MAKPISCIITDDEPFARKGLQGYVEKTGFLDLKAVCEDAISLNIQLQQQPVDLLFLDIQMPHITGIEFLRSLRNPPKVIFTTAFKEYAIEGFELDVLDYLLKPIPFERFLKAANKVKEYFDLINSSNKPDYLFVKTNGKLEKVIFEEILYIEGLENYVVVHTGLKKLIVHSTLKALLEKLPAQLFMQVHKSYIAAVNKVDAIDGNMLKVGMQLVPMSRQLREKILNVLISRG